MIASCLTKMDSWYKGDGMYGDGRVFQMDYYNSFVIYPFINQAYAEFEINGVDVPMQAVSKSVDLDQRSRRYAEIQERSINPDGTYFPIGRSLTYRAGAFHHLANVALSHMIPNATLSPPGVRSALTAVIRKTTEHPDTFMDSGWLNVGVYGHQPKMADFYINTRSLYLHMCVSSL